LVYTVHGFAHTWDDLGIRALMLERTERMLAPRTDLLLFQSQEDLDQVRARHYRVRTAYLGNGVQDHWFTGPVQAPLPPRDQAMFVGRLVREKGVIDLLDALEKVPDLRLSIAGTQLPTERDGLGDLVESRAASAPLAGRVALLGMVDSAALTAHLHSSAFLVLPSYREGVPRSIIEGMAAGRPAIVTDVRGCRELITHGVNGFVVPPGEPRSLARAMEAMVSLSDVEYEAMSRAAFDAVSTRFRESTVIDRLVAAYSSVGFPPPVA
jgi:glycosyltransferase involved in cell wall biosynthesis